MTRGISVIRLDELSNKVGRVYDATILPGFGSDSTGVPDAARPRLKPKPRKNPILSKQPTLYVVGYAHLDTEWRWEYPQVISEYIRKTMEDNFTLFDKYPHYVFNFSGANRYRFMKEYFPADFARLKKYVDEGRWFPTGSSMEEGDVNAPSAEAIIRQVLYGNDWFRKELGKASAEYMLPDCFGFPSSLPTILAHSGVKGFSTQKLVWGSSAPGGGPESLEKTPEGTPFQRGRVGGTGWRKRAGRAESGRLQRQGFTPISASRCLHCRRMPLSKTFGKSFSRCNKK